MSLINKHDKGPFAVFCLTILCILGVSLGGLYTRQQANYRDGCIVSAYLDDSGRNYGHAICAEDPLLFGDGLAQWVMALLAFIATGASIWALLILRDTLEQSRVAAVAATKAAEEATKSTAIMQADQRPWIMLSIIPTILRFADSSNSLMLSLRVSMVNKGRTPAIDLAVYGAIKIIPKGQQNGLTSENYTDLRKKVLERAAAGSGARSGMIDVVFQDQVKIVPEHCIHATLAEFPHVSATEDICLVGAFAIVHSYGNRQGGAIWHSIISPAETRSLFSYSIEKVKAGPTIVQAAAPDVAYF